MDATELAQARAFAVVLAGTTAAPVTKERRGITSATGGAPDIPFVRCFAPACAPDTCTCLTCTCAVHIYTCIRLDFLLGYLSSSMVCAAAGYFAGSYKGRPPFAGAARSIPPPLTLRIWPVAHMHAHAHESGPLPDPVNWLWHWPLNPHGAAPHHHAPRHRRSHPSSSKSFTCFPVTRLLLKLV